jgi:hypothetical protein
LSASEVTANIAVGNEIDVDCSMESLPHQLLLATTGQFDVGGHKRDRNILRASDNNQIALVRSLVAILVPVQPRQDKPGSPGIRMEPDRASLSKERVVI